MADFTRRGFLTQMSITTGVGIAGGLGLHKLLASDTPKQGAESRPPSEQPASQQQQLIQQAALNLGGITLAGPMLLHVRDVPTGEVSMMVGTRELIYRDPELVSRLVDKARSAEG
jgi:hypothetical protein